MKNTCVQLTGRRLTMLAAIVMMLITGAVPSDKTHDQSAGGANNVANRAAEIAGNAMLALLGIGDVWAGDSGTGGGGTPPPPPPGGGTEPPPPPPPPPPSGPAPTASFTLCDSTKAGEPGGRIDVFADGKTVITKIRCS
ncbi:MAG: hypothetical protein ACE5H7_14030 [Acidiferrobacterales bacterium]